MPLLAMARPTPSSLRVGGGGVDVAVAGAEGVGDCSLGLLRRDWVDAEAEDGHADPVVEGDLGDRVRHGEHHYAPESAAFGGALSEGYCEGTLGAPGRDLAFDDVDDAQRGSRSS